MADTTQFTIGAAATCSDGHGGIVTMVVVDPVARAVTHLVVEPKHSSGLARFVPLDLVDATTGEIRLRCSLAAFDKLDPAEETMFLPGTGGYPGYRSDQALSWPYYGLSTGAGMGLGLGTGASMGFGVSSMPVPVTNDIVPVGEVAVRRGEHVHATDGEIGRVQGLVINPRDHRVTHVLLQEGHLWGRKQVAIPIRDVTGVDDGIRLTITKQAVGDLPPVDLAQADM